jgi:uncharacterized protein
MTTQKSRMIFVNLPVRDLPRSKAFFARLGFTFNATFTDDNAACMVVSDQASVMLLQETYFKTFTRREITDPKKSTGALFALSCESRAEVDELVKTALENGGAEAMPKMDRGFMYGGSFYDPDGHHWEVLWMDPAAVG